MLKKLRHQFIFSNMLLVGIVILALFISLTAITYNHERNLTYDVLYASLQGEINPRLFQDDMVIDGFKENKIQRPRDSVLDNERFSSVSLITVVSKGGMIVLSEQSVTSTYDNETIEKIVKECLEEEDEEGIISEYNLRYVKITSGGGYRMAFADRTSEQVSFMYLVRLFAFACIGFFVIIYFVSRFMSKKAIEPVEKSWNAQNRFVADASHELKTPLTVILANMDIMESNENSTIKDQKKWIENTKSEATRMSTLVNDMLFLAKSDAEVEETYNFQEINISKVCEDCVLTLESVAYEKGVELTSAVIPDLVTKADEKRINQVLTVLLDNSLKYVNDNGKIVVSASNTGKNIKVSVSNTGLAIPEEKQAHLFERFFRVDESRTREHGGSGLGLSIAKQIMDAHGGDIMLEYSNENGTCFSFTLPIKHK